MSPHTAVQLVDAARVELEECPETADLSTILEEAAVLDAEVEELRAERRNLDDEVTSLRLQLAERDAELESIKNHLLHAWTLECSHCGGVAAASWDGRFYEDDDNDGEGCLTCGLPGRVGVDGDAYWSEAEEGTCKDETCTTCHKEGKAP